MAAHSTLKKLAAACKPARKAKAMASPATQQSLEVRKGCLGKALVPKQGCLEKAQRR